MPKKKRIFQYRLRLNEEELEMLNKVSGFFNLPKSKTLRYLIESTYNTISENKENNHD